MGVLIERNNIDGLKVYGQQQVDYTVSGVAHQGYDDAVRTVALKESEAIEAETQAYMDILSARQQKLSELGDALAILAKAVTSMKVKDQTSGDKSSEMAYDLQRAQSILSKYGISLSLTDNNTKVTREQATKAQNNCQYEMDNENNDLQQDMVTAQGLVSKRDNAFSTAAKLVKKVHGTADLLINNL